MPDLFYNLNPGQRAGLQRLLNDLAKREDLSADAKADLIAAKVAYYRQRNAERDGQRLSGVSGAATDRPPPPTLAERAAQARAVDASIAHGNRAFRSVMILPCEAHHAAPHRACWRTAPDAPDGRKHQAVCGARIEAWSMRRGPRR